MHREFLRMGVDVTKGAGIASTWKVQFQEDGVGFGRPSL